MFSSKVKFIFYLFSYLLLSGVPLQAQTSVYKVACDSGFLKFPWTGGLDACQFAAIDLNKDGFDDLVVFDRRGNRWLCFLNNGLARQISYTWAPQYIKFFPEVSDWVIFADYDGDGRPDLFTYSPGWAGIRVFRNVGDHEPQFVPIIDPYLSSFQSGGYVNIISTNADQLGIADLDGDGDLDLLTFWALGTFIEQHTNRSKEIFGHTDSLVFEKTSFCWGRIAESEENNLIYLDTCLFNRAKTHFRHRGATMLIHDFTGNGLLDLLLGDVDYPGLNLLVNEGDLAQAYIVAQDTLFPSTDIPVRLYSMPGAYLIDANNDGLKDLIVSPFDPNFEVTENYSSIWLYLNHGSAKVPHFKLHTKRFLQDETIDLGSGAFPVMYDVNGDGLKDIVVGNIGRYIRSWYVGNTLHSAYESFLHVYEQQLTESGMTFVRTHTDLAGLSALGRRGLVPAFADINGNGLADMLVGNEAGGIIYVAQISPGNWQIRSTLFGGIQTPKWSVPALFDLDEDGITDLLIGSQNGRIIFYKGIAIGDSTGFAFVTQNLGNIDVTNYNFSYEGFSTPQPFYAADGRPMLVVGSEQGKIWLFDNIRGNLSGIFTESSDWQAVLDTNVQMIRTGYRSSAFVGRLTNAPKLQMLVGNFSGGLELWNAHAEVAPSVSEINDENLKLWPNPAKDRVYFTVNLPENGPATFMIIDFSGKEVVSRRRIELSGGSGMLTLPPLAKGAYLLIVKLKDNTIFRAKLLIGPAD